MNRNWRCPSGRTFFGLTGEYMESIYEMFFILKHYGGWSLFELYNLPIGLRNWFIKRLAKQLKAEKEAVDNASKGGGSGGTHELNSSTQSMLSQYGAPSGIPDLKGRS